jgi:sugar phosphate isomerase/epimerase
VHIKDRAFNGPTVPLGNGGVDFLKTFSSLLEHHLYSGNFILQTARSKNDDHVGSVLKYLDFTNNLLNNFELTKR